MGIKIIVPPRSKEEEPVIIEGPSVACVTRAAEKVQKVLDEAVRSRNLDYSHFVSLPLAVHPELVDKLVSFLGNDDRIRNENDSSEDSSDNDVKDRETNKKVEEGNHVRVDRSNIPLVSCAPKASQAKASNSGIERSIFIKPQTFHLTVLMLKLWNKERVNAASEILKECMRGSLAKARVLYAAVEESGAEDRLLHACRIQSFDFELPYAFTICVDMLCSFISYGRNHPEAFTEGGLVLEKDANEQLKLHATLMNARHRKGKQRRNMNSFDARGAVKLFGEEDWASISSVKLISRKGSHTMLMGTTGAVHQYHCQIKTKNSA